MRLLIAVLATALVISVPAVAADCLVLGDSIAVGLSSALAECRVDAKAGISSPSFADTHVARAGGDLVVISLGSNDGRGDTTAALERVRARITAAPRVLWLVPNVGARTEVLAVAAGHGDQVVDIRPFVGGDGVHPTENGYRELARRARGGTP